MNKLLRAGALAGGLLLQSAACGVYAQENKPADKGKADEAPELPAKEEWSTTEHTIRLGGQTIAYKAMAGTTLLKNAKEEPTALLYSTSYIRTDAGDPAQRPIAFIYNGGPGSASIWLHMGAFGPRHPITPNAEKTPPPPYKFEDNPHTLLDKTDMVFVDPVGTGYSHAVGKAQNKDFYGIDQDMVSLAQFITTYVTRNNRWNSPKFLMGESYGTFRSAVLGNYLQSKSGMDLNGIVLISSVMKLAPYGDLDYVFGVPTSAAAAWYHNVIPNKSGTLEAWVDEARKFALGEYNTALAQGSHLSPAERTEIAKKLSHFIGLSEDYILKANLRVNSGQFGTELLRSRGLVTAGNDIRYTGYNPNLLSETAETDSDLPQGVFLAMFNTYVHNELKFGEDKVYHRWATDNTSWDLKHNGMDDPDVGIDLANAIVRNPHLKVEVENGIFDPNCYMFQTEYEMSHLHLPDQLRGNVELKFYYGGHMMYMNPEEAMKLTENIDKFVESASHK